ncbi:MFS transporter [Arachidicoccus ginsenosidimutans]|uniref:MFS transporter n=1 Tax=Arachidicoccus sp. BS20 TaxID=1850526 RepID=UPI0007F05A8B|nr:MFS transporter [Arachidicoccus sp. BS20]ANI88547.1 MFS transporter [Arachidicoccus sp. BS20]
MKESNGITKSQIAVLSIAAGVCVANIYYNQPILSDIQKELHLQEKQVGNLPVLSQAGYGLGLLLLTPLGDKIERKKLIIIMQLLLIAVLCGLTFTHSLIGLYVMSFLIGCIATATQVILPMAAAMATKDKGKIVGIVFTGVLVGILGARIFSGYIADWFSWRYVFGISACMLVVTTLMVAFMLPKVKPTYKGHYGQLLSSTLIQLKRFSLLRRISLLGVFTFGTFCSFWTTLTFHLSGAPFNYKSDTIGLFGVLAIGGALVAPLFGKLADKSNPAKNQLLSVAIIIISVLLIQIFPYSLTAFIITTFLMDVGVQATQVTNLAQVYTLDESAHSRINTMYMTLMFIGGAFGTWIGVKCWTIGGWSLVSWQLLLWACIAMLIAFVGYSKSIK